MNSSSTTYHDDGVIKFHAEWQQSRAYDEQVLADLISWRQQIYDWGLIGVYDDGVAFGNISQRIPGTDQFYISGSATGSLTQIDARHFSRVERVDIQQNKLWCSGPVIASSESMSHAVLYQMDDTVNAIIHGHHAGLWQMMLDQVPTTPVNVTYGTPEMAMAIEALFSGKKLRDGGVFVMAGHEEGVFSFGSDLQVAASYLRDHLERLPADVGS